MQNSIPTVASTQTIKRQSHLFSQNQVEVSMSPVLFAEILLTSGSATWRLERSLLRWIWLSLLYTARSRMWQQTSIWGLSVQWTPPPWPGTRNPFMSTDFTRPAGSSSPPSALCCVGGVLGKVQCPEDTTHHRPLAELAVISNLRTNRKTNKQITSKTFP